MTDQTNTEQTPTTAAPVDDRTIVVLGNRAPVDVFYKDVDGKPVADRVPITGVPRKHRTDMRISPESSLLDALQEVVAAWRRCSDDQFPPWVASTDPNLAILLGAQWKCEVREYEPDHDASGADDIVPAEEA